MELSSGVRFRCYPTDKQAGILSQWIGCQRFIYNAKVSEDRYFRKFLNHSLSLAGTQTPVDQQYAQFKSKELTPFLYGVPSQVLRNSATRFMGAYQRYFKGLAERPTFKKKAGRQTVWLTNELFMFEPKGTKDRKQGGTISEHRLMLGTKTKGLGELRFKAHSEYGLPSTITITRAAGKWFVSFSYDKACATVSEEELIAYYGAMMAEELDQIALGMDRGVVIPVATSAKDNSYDFTDEQKYRLYIKETRRKRYQRQMARREKGSCRQRRMAQKIAGCHAYAANARHDFAHKASRKIVDSAAEVFVFEDLKVKNMTRAPKPKKSGSGKHLPNGTAAKAGLNKSILESAWGKVRQFTTYKARKINKLVIGVPPNGTSQECSKCSHTHPDNRKTQSEFVCQNCGFTENADYNASLVIKKTGIRMLLDGEISVKQKKRVMRLKKRHQLGRELAEVTHGEKEIRRSVGTACGTLPSLNRETPTTIPAAI
jgi:putative transposase